MGWSVPKMWEGQPCVIFGGGESMSQQVADAVRYHAGYRVIVVNNAIELAPWADMLYAADTAWWMKNLKLAKAFGGLRVTVEEGVPIKDMLVLKPGSSEGFDPDPGIICTGGNSGYQALCIAVHAGCTRILLCGFDMRPRHWHKEHEWPLRVTTDERYEQWVKRFATLVVPLHERGVKVMNCSPGSALRCWPEVELEEALRMKDEVVA